MNRQPHPVTVLKRDFPVGGAQILLDSGGRGVISSFCFLFMPLNSRFRRKSIGRRPTPTKGGPVRRNSSYGLMKFFFFLLMVPARVRVIRFGGDRLRGSPKSSFLLSLPLIGIIEQEYR